MAETRFPAPPPPSLPKEAPWREIEAIIERLDNLISVLSGLPPGVTPPAIDGRLDALVNIGSNIYSVLQTISGMPGVSPSHIPIEWGKATGGAKDKLLCMGKAWADDIWAGYEFTIIEGSGTGQSRRIKTNDRTSLTPQSDFDTNPDNTSVFVIRANRAVLANKPAWTHGQKDVTAAGTAEQLPDVEVPDGCQLTIIAKPANTDTIYLGKSKADCEDTSKRFDGLSAGLATSLQVDNANKFWVDAAVSGEGVSYHVEQVS